MAKSGRPRKPGERYPSGQLKPEPIAPALLVRIRTAAEQGYADPRLASQIGRLFFHRELTSAEAATAFRIGEVYGRYERNNGLRRTTKSPSYELGAGVALRRALDVDEMERTKTDAAVWLALQDELSSYPRQARGIIEALCVEDVPFSLVHLPDIKKILGNLARFFRSSKSRKRKRRPASQPMYPMYIAKAPDAAPKRRLDRDRLAWLAVQRKLSPHLDERQLQGAYEIFVAMKERADFNDAKMQTPH